MTQATTTPTMPLTVDLPWLVEHLGKSRRWFFSEMGALRFPAADGKLGNQLKWRRDTIQTYLDKHLGSPPGGKHFV